ncbi:MAG: EH signature domain-containing protein, partial [Halothece sp.]
MNDSINFQTFSFPQVSPQSPKKLCTLADSLGNKRKYYEFYKLQQMAIQLPRSLSEIIQVIQTGKEETISRLEWTYCVSAKQEWDQENPCLAQETSLKIWELSNSNSWLQGLLLWLLSLSYTETDKIVLADSIKKTFLEFYSHSSNSNNVAVEILVAIAQKNYKKIAKISSQFSVTPEDLLQQNNLASNIPAVKKAEDYLVNVFATDFNEHWLLHCFNTMSQEQELKQVEKLLKTIPVKKGETLHSIVQWLQNRYNPRSIHSRWNSLSPEAQSALSNWIGAVNWKQFEKLVDILLRQLDPDDYQYNQLKRRRDFWSNYSDRFQRLRILLPQESANRISQELKQDVDILKEDGSETTEVCIFDFGDIFA